MSGEGQSILNASTDSVASANFIALHEKINSTDERLNDINEQTKKKFQIIKENISQIRKKIEEERANSDNYTQIKNNCIKSLEDKLTDRFNEEQEIRQEIEKKFNSLIDEKFIALKIEISKESRNRYQCIENLKTYLENDFPKLQGMVKIEQGDRENNDISLNKKIIEEVTRLQNDVSENKKTREETEEAILEMLRVMITKMKGDIEKERKDRELTEETFLSILEETCNKLNQASQI